MPTPSDAPAALLGTMGMTKDATSPAAPASRHSSATHESAQNGSAWGLPPVGGGTPPLRVSQRPENVPHPPSEVARANTTTHQKTTPSGDPRIRPPVSPEFGFQNCHQ